MSISFRRRAASALLGACFLGGALSGTLAQETWPTQEVRIYVPASPGGSTDLIARALQPFLEEELGVPIVIVNQTAGGGAVATNSVATAEPDGGTILLHHALLHTTHLFGRSPLSYKDFAALGTVSEVNNVLVASSDAPFGTLAEMKEYAAANPDELTLASQLGGTTQVMGEAVAGWADDNIRIVDAGAEADRLASLLGGQVDLALLTASTAVQYDEAGQINVLAVFNDKPEPAAPDWPTAPSAGLEMSLPLVFTLAAPKDLPEDLRQRFGEALGAFAESEEFKAAIEDISQVPSYRTPEEAAAHLDQEFAFISDIIKPDQQ